MRGISAGDKLFLPLRRFQCSACSRWMRVSPLWSFVVAVPATILGTPAVFMACVAGWFYGGPVLAATGFAAVMLLLAGISLALPLRESKGPSSLSHS